MSQNSTSQLPASSSNSDLLDVPTHPQASAILSQTPALTTHAKSQAPPPSPEKALNKAKDPPNQLQPRTLDFSPNLSPISSPFVGSSPKQKIKRPPIKVQIIKLEQSHTASWNKGVGAQSALIPPRSPLLLNNHSPLVPQEHPRITPFNSGQREASDRLGIPESQGETNDTLASPNQTATSPGNYSGFTETQEEASHIQNTLRPNVSLETVSEFRPESQVDFVKDSSHFSESDLAGPFIRLSEKQRAYSVESSNGPPHLRVLQLKLGSDDKDTCDTSQKTIVQQQSLQSNATSSDQTNSDMKLLLIDKEPQEFDPHEIATLLNEKFLKRKLTEMKEDQVLTVELEKEEEDQNQCAFTRIVSSSFAPIDHFNTPGSAQAITEEDLEKLVEKQVQFETSEDTSPKADINSPQDGFGQHFSNNSVVEDSKDPHQSESRKQVVQLSNESDSDSQSDSKDSSINEEEFRTILKQQANYIQKKRRQSFVAKGGLNIDGLSVTGSTPSSRGRREERRNSTFSPQKLVTHSNSATPKSVYENTSFQSDNALGSNLLKVVSRNAEELPRTHSSDMQLPKSKFSRQKMKNVKYAKYYKEGSDEGTEDLQNLDIHDFLMKMIPTSNYELDLSKKESEEKKENVEESDEEIQQDDEEEEEKGDGCTHQLYVEHMVGMYKALVYLKNIEKPSDAEIKARRINLPPLDKKKKTLVFDLDQTLIHCVDNIELEKPDTVLYVHIPGSGMKRAGINVRPLALECLQFAHEYFEVIVFTASHRAYADAVLDYLDPHHEYIDYRFYRQHCVQTKQRIYMKDLRVLGNRDLNKVTIIDNHVYSFGFQLDNGIPILPFYNDKQDMELDLLMSYFKKLLKVQDVRTVHRKFFEFSELLHKNIENFVKFYEEDSDQDQEEQEMPRIVYPEEETKREGATPDSSGSSTFSRNSTQDQADGENNEEEKVAGDTGSDSVPTTERQEVERRSMFSDFQIQVQRIESPPDSPPRIPLEEVKDDDLTELKSPNYLEQDPIAKSRIHTPKQSACTPSPSILRLIQKNSQAMRLPEIGEEEEGRQPMRKKNSEDLKTLIGKFITPDGKHLTKSLKQKMVKKEKLPKKSQTPQSRGVKSPKRQEMKLQEYHRKLELLKIRSNSPGADDLTRSDTNQEIEFNRQLDQIGEFFLKSSYLQGYSKGSAR